MDLAVGLLAANPSQAELRILLDHCRVRMGAVIGGYYSHPFTASELRAARSDGPDPVGPPSVDATAEFVIRTAVSLASQAAGVVEPEHLLGALLQVETNEAAAGFNRNLRSRGIEPSHVLRTYQAWVGSPSARTALGEHLAETLPIIDRCVNVARIADDRPIGTAESDFIGIQAEVDAFAYLLTATSLAPPLAIGLFGAWGSGKSFFVQSLRRRIAEITDHPEVRETPSSQLPFFKNVVQIEFNAWQYVEGNLWASLVAHIFDRLADDEQQKELLLQLETAKEAIAGATKERDELERQLSDRRDRRGDLEQELRERQDKSPLAAALTSGSVRIAARAALARLGFGELSEQASHASGQLAAARDVYQRASRLGLAVQQPGTVALLVVATLVAFVASWALGEASLPALTKVIASLAPVAGALVAALRAGVSYANKGLSEIEEAQTELAAQISEQLARYDEESERLRRRRDEADLGVQALQGQLANVTARITSLEEGSPRLINEFVLERAQSDDYRRHLGLPALIRRDFDTLSTKVVRNNMKLIGGEPGDQTLSSVNRIVLFIDDLDRCSIARVVEVLQAVHLLLAFPLFVVVVAVDSRWLANSLRSHYKDLLGDDREEAKASPGDYLEKIFQVPFWVEELTPTARKQLLGGLLRDAIEAPAAAESGDSGQTATESDPEFDNVIGSLFRSSQEVVPWLAAARQTITRSELERMEALTALLGSTPRSVKRFVNVYQLVKGIAASRVAELETDQLLSLLALTTGAPAASRVILDLIGESPQLTLGQLAGQVEAKHPLVHERLRAWFATCPSEEQRQLSSFADCVPYVRRFTFSSRQAG